jgi:hypothetical protein
MLVTDIIEYIVFKFTNPPTLTKSYITLLIPPAIASFFHLIGFSLFMIVWLSTLVLAINEGDFIWIFLIIFASFPGTFGIIATVLIFLSGWGYDFYIDLSFLPLLVIMGVYLYLRGKMAKDE